MLDRQFSERHLAALYDSLCGRDDRDDFVFYLPMVMSYPSVLDVGCCTGALLHMARDAGHTGRLVGLDPARGMLEEARRRSDVEWVLGDLSSRAFDEDFDLVVMTGHAFQVFVEDDEIRSSLAAIRAALADDGRFAFETRNPLAREWERWTPENGADLTGPDGVEVRFEPRADSVDGDTVRFTITYTSRGWDRPRRARAPSGSSLQRLCPRSSPTRALSSSSSSVTGTGVSSPTRAWRSSRSLAPASATKSH